MILRYCKSMPRNKAIAFDCISEKAFSFCHAKDDIYRCFNCTTRLENIRNLFQYGHWQTEHANRHLVARLICIVKGKVAGPYPTIDNLRPIVVASYVIKLLERPIFDQLQTYVKLQISDSQAGFRPGLNTKDNHKKLIKMIKKFDHRGLVVFYDFASAFETIDRHRLICKLKEKNILTDTNLQLLQFLMTKLEIQHGGFKTKSEAGVPQGLAISPLLFIIFIDDLLKDLKANGLYTIAFADDICGILRTANCLTKYDKIMRKYCSENNLHINEKKCGILLMDKKTRDSLGNRPSYSNIPLVKTYRFLGINTSGRFDLKGHLEEVKKSCSRLITMIQPYYSKATFKTQALLFKTLITTKLKYCSEWASELGPDEEARLRSTERYLLKKLFRLGLNINNELVEALLNMLYKKISNRENMINKSIQVIRLFNRATDLDKSRLSSKKLVEKYGILINNESLREASIKKTC